MTIQVMIRHVRTHRPKVSRIVIAHPWLTVSVNDTCDYTETVALIARPRRGGLSVEETITSLSY